MSENQQKKLRCPLMGCKTPKEKQWHLLCPEHWGKTPERLRDGVWEAYKNKRGTPDHRAACARVIRWHFQQKETK